jgi:hypothetical protein
VGKLSSSEIYATASAIVLLLLALINNAWLMLGISIVGLAAGLILARKPAPSAGTAEPGQAEGQQTMFGSLRRAGVVALLGFAVALVLAVIILIRG